MNTIFGGFAEQKAITVHYSTKVNRPSPTICANYVINRYAARVEIAIKRMEIEVRAPRVNGTVRMDKTDQAVLDQLTKSNPTSTPPMSDAERDVLGRGIH